jgi:hypothetical protein
MRNRDWQQYALQLNAFKRFFFTFGHEVMAREAARLEAAARAADGETGAAVVNMDYRQAERYCFSRTDRILELCFDFKRLLEHALLSEPRPAAAAPLPQTAVLRAAAAPPPLPPQEAAPLAPLPQEAAAVPPPPLPQTAAAAETPLVDAALPLPADAALPLPPQEAATAETLLVDAAPLPQEAVPQADAEPAVIPENAV